MVTIFWAVLTGAGIMFMGVLFGIAITETEKKKSKEESSDR